MPKGRGSNLRRSNRIKEIKDLRINQSIGANRRQKEKKKPIGNISRHLKGIHKRGRGKREVVIKSKRDFNLIEFQINNS